MKRTTITQTLATAATTNTPAKVVVCDPFIFSRTPEKAEIATLVSAFWDKEGMSHQPIAGSHVEVHTDSGEVKFVMPNMIIGLAGEVEARSAETAAKSSEAKAKDAATLQAAKDRLDAVLATFVAMGVAPTASKDARTVSFTVEQLEALSAAMFPAAN